MNHAKFFAAIRLSLFGGRLSANQVDGMGAILAARGAAPFDMR
jgi:putative chitinase